MSVDRYDVFGMKSKEDFTETVKILLNYGADVNALNARGETPMHLAARNEFQKVIEVLVLAGCDPLAKDNDGNQAVDLTLDGDTVSLQILRHAATERDRYMSESMEIRARGFTTLTQSQAALPLSVRSPSLLSMPLLLGAARSAQNLTRTASSPGLFPSPPHSATFLGQMGSGPLSSPTAYLQTPGVMIPQNGYPQMFNRSPVGVGIVPRVEPARSDVYSNLPEMQFAAVPNGTVVPNRGSVMSQITAPSDNVYRLSMNSAGVYSLIGPSERSTVWNVTPPPSVNNPNTRRPEKSVVDVDSESWIGRQAMKNQHWETEELNPEKPKEVPERRRRKILKKKSKSSTPPAVAEKPTAPKRVPDVQVSEPLPDDNDTSDTFFDDESFDTFVESPVSEEEHEQPPPLPPRTRSSQGSSVGADGSNLQRWLEEQNGLMHTDRSVTSDTTSYRSIVSGSNPPERPPRLSRPSSVTSSTDTVKRRPPPPVPVEVRKEKVKSQKKKSKKRVIAAKNVADVESEEVTRRPDVRKQHATGTVDQSNRDAPKSSARKGKKKTRELNVCGNGDVYSNVNVVGGDIADEEKSRAADTLSNSSWATNETVVNTQKSRQPPQDASVQLSAARLAQPLVFEKVTIQDDQIANDYLFHRSIAELTNASAENIVACVGRKMSSESSPPAVAPVSASVRYPPETVFQYALESSFADQTSPQYCVQQQYPAHRLQAIYSNLSPIEEPQEVMQKTEDDLPLPSQPPQQNRPAYSANVQSEVSPVHDQSSGSLYDTLDDDKVNKYDSGVSEDLMPPYGLNRRTVVLKSEGKLGLSICGGNVSGTFVRSVVPHSAAAAADLTVGDWIVAVNGKVVKSSSKQEVLQMIESLARDSVRLVVDRDDDRFKLAVAKNAVGDSFYVRAYFSYIPAARGRELTVKEGDVFQVSDSLPQDAVGYWVAKKADGVIGEPEGLIPNYRKAEQIITKQRLTASPMLNRPRGGVFMRSFRRSKYSDRSSDVDQDSLDSRQSSECGDAVSYVRVVEQPSSVRRPVVIMGLFCDAVCTVLKNSASTVFEVPRTAVEQRRASGEEFTPYMLDLATVRDIVNAGRHCLMVISPRAVHFLREKTELNPIVIYMSPSSKSVLKSMIQQLAPNCQKKPGFMLEEAAKFERYHAALFDAVIPYKADDSWLDLLKDSVGRLQRIRTWIPFVPEDTYVANDSSPPDLIRTTRTSSYDDRQPDRLSKTTDDIPDQIQDLLSRHINVVSPMIFDQQTGSTSDLCTQSFDFGDRQPVLVKPPKAVPAGPHGDVVLRKLRTKGRPFVNRDNVVSKVVHLAISNECELLLHPTCYNITNDFHEGEFGLGWTKTLLYRFPKILRALPRVTTMAGHTDVIP